MTDDAAGPTAAERAAAAELVSAERAAAAARFADAPRRLTAAARAVAGRDAPAAVPGEWGPPEIVRHLIAVEHEVWWVRFEALRTEDEPHWSWTEPGLEPGLDDASLDDLVARFTDDRGRSVSILEAFQDADWSRTGVHVTYGRLDVMGLLRLATDHDAEHLASLDPG
jgi:DinB superfamily